MNFIQNQIDEGFTRIIITNRGLKEDLNRLSKFEVFKYDIRSIEDYNRIVESPLHKNHPNGFSIGFAKP